MSFKGIGHHTINENGRISIPAKMREVLKDKYGDKPLTLVLFGCHLVVYPDKEWEKVEQVIQAVEIPDNKGAMEHRRLYQNMEEVTVDKNGRILISPSLREKARLNGECSIVGLFGRMEIWSREIYESDQGEAAVSGEPGSLYGHVFR